ncbi:hypothetical protein P4S72_23500 [Vibrio sp. PP-XX7]
MDWRYLTPHGWEILPGSAVGARTGNARIIEDSTQQLLNPGIVAIEFPVLDDTLSGLGDGLLWLQVSIFNLDMSPVRYSIIKGVYTQGVAATLVSEGVDASHYQQPLAAESVSGLEEPDPAIVPVLQP